MTIGHSILFNVPCAFPLSFSIPLASFLSFAFICFLFLLRASDPFHCCAFCLSYSSLFSFRVASFLFLSHCHLSFPLYSVSCPLFLVWFLSPSFCFLLPCPGLSHCFLFLVLLPCPLIFCAFPFLFLALRAFIFFRVLFLSLSSSASSLVFLFPFCFHVLFFTNCFLFLFHLLCPFLLFVYAVKAVAFKVFFCYFGGVLSSKKSWCFLAVSRFFNMHTLDQHSNWPDPSILTVHFCWLKNIWGRHSIFLWKNLEKRGILSSSPSV